MNKKTPKSYNHGRKMDGTIATEADWETWREEFWELELKHRANFTDKVYLDDDLDNL